MKSIYLVVAALAASTSAFAYEPVVGSKPTPAARRPSLFRADVDRSRVSKAFLARANRKRWHAARARH
jgi:hypothetical protein